MDRPDVTDRLALLPDAVANRLLTPGFVKGNDALRTAVLRTGTETLDESSRWEAGELRRLLSDAMRMFPADPPTGADAWLAPRLHYVMRITRAEASNTALWNFVALRVAPDYVRWRWGKATSDGRREVGQAARFSGRWDLQCFSRLWWAAELFRNGSDYAPVAEACSNQDMLNTTLRLEMMQHRPVAQAFICLLRNGVMRTGRDVNGLVSAVGAAGSTLVYEVLAPDEPRDFEALQEWLHAGNKAIPYKDAGLPEGPDDGSVPRGSVEKLGKRFEELFLTAPVRGSNRSDCGSPTEVPAAGVSLGKAYVTA